jgi:hypothetical protein
VLQLAGGVRGEATVDRPRLEHGAARRLEEPEPDAGGLVGHGTHGGIAGADATYERQPLADRVDVQSR